MKTPNIGRFLATAIIALPAGLFAIDTDSDGLDDSVTPTIARVAGPAVSKNTTILVVGEIVWGATDTINLYLPDTSLTLGAAVATQTGVLNQANFDTITSSLKTNSGYGFDEIRFGATYQDAIGMGGATGDYDDWAALYDPADLSDSGGDLDRDGLANDCARIWGLDPTSASSVNPYAVPLDASGTFSYTRRKPTLTGLTYTVWTSSDLQAWTKAGDADAAQVAGTPDLMDVETVEVTLSAALLGEPRLFVRIQAAGP